MVTTEDLAFHCERWWRERGRLKASVDALLGGEVVHSHVFKLDGADERRAFAEDVLARLNGHTPPLEDVERRLLNLLQRAKAEPTPGPTEPAEDDPSGRPRRVGEYCRISMDGGGRMLGRVKRMEDQAVETPIATFDAWVVEEVRVDEEAGPPKIEIAVEGLDERGRSLPLARVTAERFDGLGWLTEHWGIGAVVLAGQREHARVAIQRLSGTPPRRTVYAHTGFRCIGGRRVFLHAGGAIGAEGVVAGIEVVLPEKLARHALPPPPDNPAEALRAVLAALDVAERRVTLLLVAIMVAAVLDSAVGPIASLLLLGGTGLRKSTLIALFLHLYGGPFEAQTPVTTWEDTANALEKLAHQAKDLPLWADDIRPTTTRREREQQQQAVQRLLRGAVTRSGRGRLGADLRARAVYRPRGPVVTSAEELPDNSSTLARTLVARAGEVDLDRLSAAQARAADLFPLAGAAWIRHLAGELDALTPILREEAGRRRAELVRRYPKLHGGIADSAGRLAAAGAAFFAFCAACGAIDEAGARALQEELVGALEQAALDTAEFVQRVRPSVEFLEVLRALFRTRRGVLGGISGGDTAEMPAEGAEQFGWRLVKGEGGNLDWAAAPGAVQLGWYDADERVIYLLPTVAMREAAVYSRELRAGTVLNAEATYRELAGRGLLARADQGRHTTTKRVDGKKERVLALKLEALLGETDARPNADTEDDAADAERRKYGSLPF